MIPKIIHYCWLSNDPIPDDLQEYMNTWKEQLPEYQLILWDFQRFDISTSIWVKEAFESKKYAFAADYIRLYALYNYGGIYLDMDVEVIKPFDDFLRLNSMLCYENSNDGRLEVAAFGVEKHSPWVGDCLNYYKDKHFINEDGSFNSKVLPLVIKELLTEKKYQLKNVVSIESAINEYERFIPVFPFDYFSPKSYKTQKIDRTLNTYCIHHFAGSWIPKEQKYEKKIWKALGMKPHRFMWHIDNWLKKFFKIIR